MYIFSIFQNHLRYFQNYSRKIKGENYKFLNLCRLTTESFLAFWPLSYNYKALKKEVYISIKSNCN